VSRHRFVTATLEQCISNLDTSAVRFYQSGDESPHSKESRVD